MGYRRYDAAEIADLGRDAHRANQSEHREALRRNTLGACPPGRHHMMPDRNGGGTCTHCGDTIGADEL